MRPLSTAWRRVRAVFERNRIEHDMDREMRAHLDLLAEEYERSGLSPDDARMAAKRRFGNTGHLKERGRDVRGAGLLEDLARDFAYAVRTYRRSPILAAVIILSLALGIGANTALFSVVDAAYLRKLPVPEPDQLVGFLWRAANWRPDDLRWSASTTGDSDSPGIEIVSSPAFSRTAYAAFRANAADLQDTFAFGRRTGASVTIDGESDATTVQAVSGSYFGGLGVQATLGRPLTDEDDREAASPVALLSHPAWQSRFGGDPAALGRSILLNGAPFTIVGVAAEEFTGTDGLGAADFFVPLPFETEATGARIEANTWSIKTMGRLRPGVVPEQVRARLSGVFRGTAGEAAARAPADDALQLEVVSSSRVEPDLSFGGPADQVVYLLTAVFMVLLLVVCMNVANLLTARAATRRYEIGVRFAFGAGRRRLIRQLLTESLLLGVAGGAAGIGVAYWAKDVLASVMDRPLDLEINPSVLGFALAVSVVTGLLFGLLPAVQASRRDLYGSVQNNSRTPGRSRSWATATLLTAQVVLCVVILTGAGMLVRTLGQLPSADAGFDTSNLIAFRVNLAPLDGDRVKYNAMVDAIRAVPGVVGVGSESEILVTNSGNRTDGFQPRASGPNGDVRWGLVRLQWVGEGYFDVMGLPIVVGRPFGSGDSDGAPRVAIITESLARHLDGSALGRRIGPSAARDVQDGREFEIVGVVNDVGASNIGLDGMIFFPASQQRGGELLYAFEVRTSVVPMELVPAIRAAVAAIDVRLPVYDVTTASQLIEARLAPVRRMAVTWTLFGLLALVLTAIGLYGLLSYSVTLRTGEIGVRMALGARRMHIVRSVVGRMLLLVLFGLALGLAASRIVDITLRALVYGARVYDPASVAIVAIVLLGVTGVAGYLPARRASRTDPTVALRCE